ncbi:hypothetical protein [Bacillus horti]|uniref:Tic20 family protein n=1 Tax=Caldalkalibacillus horti TaxID=77523 RepID=A0ABT9VVL5_9BACI|nr:hypothetical protein [Bacillus horti]MDQ0165018.1 putative Tic20 family protein [Bacillus horti]
MQLESRVNKEKRGKKRRWSTLSYWIGLVVGVIAIVVILDLMSIVPSVSNLSGLASGLGQMENVLFPMTLLFLLLAFFLTDVKTNYLSLRAFKHSPLGALSIHILLIFGFLLMLTGLAATKTNYGQTGVITEDLQLGLIQGGSSLGIGIALIGLYILLRKSLVATPSEVPNQHTTQVMEKMDDISQELETITTDYDLLNMKRQDLEERINKIEEELRDIKSSL